VRDGRRLCGKLSAKDALNEQTQRRHGYRVEIAHARSPQLAKELRMSEEDVRHQLRSRAKDFKNQVVEIHRHSEERAGLIRFLLEQGIRGRAYIEAARERTDCAFLLLPMNHP